MSTLKCRFYCSRVLLKPDGTRWLTGGEVKGKLANGVGGHYSHTTSERGVSSITKADAHTSAANSRLNWRPRRFKWTRPFLRKTKSGFCACAITFQTHYTILESVGVQATCTYASRALVFKHGVYSWFLCSCCGATGYDAVLQHFRQPHYLNFQFWRSK